MSTIVSIDYLQHHRNNFPGRLIYENNSNVLEHLENREHRIFGRGHIIRQYMSGIGVITERHVPDDEVLYYESAERSLDYSESSIIDDRSHGSSTEEEEETVNMFEPVNCPCYEKSLKEEREKSGMLKNIFSLIFNFKRKKERKRK